MNEYNISVSCILEWILDCLSSPPTLPSEQNIDIIAFVCLAESSVCGIAYFPCYVESK
jgi:hypothetical protein